jgi:hypothetical protein
MMLRLLFACLFATAFLAAPSFAAPGAVAPDDAKLSILEVKYFSHPYAKESEPDRIARIERMVFGAEQTGAIEDRLARLESTTNVPSETESMPPLTPRVQKPERVSTLKSVDDANIPDSSSYPRVAELEQTLLGHAYPGDSVRERLDRLETKAFGHPSTVVDLAARVDNLNEYAAVFTVPENRRNGLDFGGLRASTSVGQSQTKFVGVVDQIEALETSVYGAKRTNKPLLQRVSSLEGSVYGASRDQSNDDLTTRVSHLWASVKPTAPSLSSLQGFNDAPSQDWRSQQNQLAQMQQQSQTPGYQTASHHSSSAQPNHHSFLKKIGKAMQVATSLAVTAVGSAAMGNYGYYPGMGMGMGGYNGFNSGFSGINSGFSPMGSAYGFGGPTYFNGFR